MKTEKEIQEKRTELIEQRTYWISQYMGNHKPLDECALNMTIVQIKLDTLNWVLPVDV